jgi:ribosome-binding factor A
MTGKNIKISRKIDTGKSRNHGTRTGEKTCTNSTVKGKTGKNDRTIKTNLQLRRSSMLERLLGDIMARSLFSFRGRQIFIGVPRVDMSKDLMNMKIFVDVFGIEQEQLPLLLKKLNENFIGQIRGLLAKRSRMKFVPEISFHYAQGNEREQKILKIIEKGDHRN